MKKGLLFSLGVVLLGIVLVSLVALFSHNYLNEYMIQDNFFNKVEERFESIENVFQQIFDEYYDFNVEYGDYTYIEENLPLNVTDNAEFKESVDEFIAFVKNIDKNVDFEVTENYTLVGTGEVNYNHGEWDDYDTIEITSGDSLDLFINVTNASVTNINFNAQNGSFRFNVTAVGINGVVKNEEQYVNIFDNLVVNVIFDNGNKVAIRSLNGENKISIRNEDPYPVVIGSLFYDDIGFSFVRAIFNVSDFGYYKNESMIVG